MKFDGHIRKLGAVDHTPLRDKVLALSPDRWLMDKTRQDLFSNVHSETESIILLFCEGWPNVEIRKRAGWDLLAREATPIVQHIAANSYAPCGVTLRAVVARLRPGGRIKRHYDKHPSFRIAHRIHVPLQTNDNVAFNIDDTRYKLEPGEAYEINNLLMHDVSNSGPDDRIHFIFDYAPPRQ